METACGSAESGDLSVYSGASLYRPVILFKHQQSAPFSADQSIPVPIERPGGLTRRTVVLCRSGKEDIEGSGNRRMQLFCTSAQDEILPPQPYQVIGSADRVKR